MASSLSISILLSVGCGTVRHSVDLQEDYAIKTAAKIEVGIVTNTGIAVTDQNLESTIVNKSKYPIFTLNLEFLPVFNYLKTINVIFVATLVLGLIILSFRKIKVFQKTVIFMIEKILLMKKLKFQAKDLKILRV